jgi:hypothetical protein
MTSSFKRRKQNTLDKLESEFRSDNPAMLQVLNYLHLAGKNRRPTTMVPRTAAIKSTFSSNSQSGSNYLPTIKPPYNNSSLDRFEDCFRSDKLIQNAIVKRTELVIGKHGRIVLDTTEEFDMAEDRDEAVKKIQANTVYQDARKQLQKLAIKPEISLHNTLKAAIIQCKVYGRSAIEMTEEEPLPENLHVLNSKRLGQVEIDPVTWEFLGVRHLDLDKGPSGMDDLLPKEQLIYFANRDFHVSPGSLYYGLSELEGVIDGSDSKRIAKQEDVKEIMKSNWAPFLILKFINPNISVTQMQEVINGMQPGLPFAHKQDIESTTVDLSGDLKKLTECIDFLNRESLRELGVPAFIGGYEQIANYANSQQILLAYKEIELEADRTWVKDIIQPQWLNKLFYRLLGIDPETDADSIEVKLSYEFEDISFETVLDKVNGALLLFDRQLVSGEKVLKIAGHEDEIEEYKLRKEEIDRQKEEMRQKFLQRGDGDGDGEDDTTEEEDQQHEQDKKEEESNPEIKSRDLKRKTSKLPSTSRSTTVNKRQASIYRKFEETLDALRDGI